MVHVRGGYCGKVSGAMVVMGGSVCVCLPRGVVMGGTVSVPRGGSDDNVLPF